MSSWIEDMVAAAGRHGVPCVVIGGAPGNGVAPSEFVGRHDDPPGGDESTGGGATEVDQLRAQVQALTAERAGWQERVASINAESAEKIAAMQTGPDQVPVVTPTGDNGSHRDVGTDAMGLEDEKLTNKLIRLGYDTAGKVSDAYEEGKLAEAKLKKDWLISVGMAIAGMFARSGGSAPTVSAGAGAGGEAAGDVPEGHVDRPWMHRLGLARDKHKELVGHQTSLAEVRANYDKRVKAVKKAGNDPDEDEEVDGLGDQIIDLEEDIKMVTAHCVALKWSMGLNPVPQEKTLDEALLESNLGPWCEQPQPRVLAGAGT